MTRRPVTMIYCALTLGLSNACATTTTVDRPPETLLQAREAYANAENSPAAHFDPAGLHAAKSSLDQAESLFDHAADSSEVEAAAYVAMRRAQQTKLDGETSRWQRRALDAQAQAKQLDSPPGHELEDARADNAIERLRLAPDITVTEQHRSTVIRLPCAELFGADDTQLSDAAREKLRRITQVLKEQGERRIVIVGYTDSGAFDDKVELSKRRAQAVADYLAAQGVPRDKLAARGLGPSNPIASNDTEPGRADNSRIEILVQKRLQR